MPSHKLIVPTVPHVFPLPGFPFTHFKPLTHSRHFYLTNSSYHTPHALELRVTFHCSDRDKFFLGTPKRRRLTDDWRRNLWYHISCTRACGTTTRVLLFPNLLLVAFTTKLVTPQAGRRFLFNTHSCVLCLALSPPPNFGRITAKIKTGWRNMCSTTHQTLQTSTVVAQVNWPKGVRGLCSSANRPNCPPKCGSRGLPLCEGNRRKGACYGSGRGEEVRQQRLRMKREDER